MSYKNQGSNWIAKSTRFAIYNRDGFRCVYCNAPVKIGTATLDHVVARENGGSNRADNLLTSCKDCNEHKGTKTIRQFFAWLRSVGVVTEGMSVEIRRQLKKELDRKEGRRIEALRKMVVAFGKVK